MEPEITITFRNGGFVTILVMVLEASLGKHYPTSRTVGSVGRAWKVPVPLSESKSCPVENTTQYRLGRGVILAYPAEPLGGFCIGNEISRLLSGSATTERGPSSEIGLHRHGFPFIDFRCCRSSETKRLSRVKLLARRRLRKPSVALLESSLGSYCRKSASDLLL